MLVVGALALYVAYHLALSLFTTYVQQCSGDSVMQFFEGKYDFRDVA